MIKVTLAVAGRFRLREAVELERGGNTPRAARGPRTLRPDAAGLDDSVKERVQSSPASRPVKPEVEPRMRV